MNDYREFWHTQLQSWYRSDDGGINWYAFEKENEMKNEHDANKALEESSHYTRYSKIKRERIDERVSDWITAIAIGVGLAVALVAWWQG